MFVNSTSIVALAHPYRTIMWRAVAKPGNFPSMPSILFILPECCGGFKDHRVQSKLARREMTYGLESLSYRDSSHEHISPNLSHTHKSWRCRATNKRMSPNTLPVRILHSKVKMVTFFYLFRSFGSNFYQITMIYDNLATLLGQARSLVPCNVPLSNWNGKVELSTLCLAPLLICCRFAAGRVRK